MSLRDLPSSPLYGDNSPFTIQTAKTFFFKPRQSKQDKTKNSCWDSLRRSIQATPESRQLQNQFVGLAGASPPRQPMHASPEIFGNLNCNLQSRRRIPGMAQTVRPLATPEGNLPHALRRAYGGRKKIKGAVSEPDP